MEKTLTEGVPCAVHPAVIPNRKLSILDHPKTVRPFVGAVNASNAVIASLPMSGLATVRLSVIKSDGSSEVYDREKLMRGLLIACAKRPISPEQVATLIESIESELRNASKNEIKSKELGDMALVRLAKLDDVAYVRFASVYKDFQNIEEFAAALEGMS